MTPRSLPVIVCALLISAIASACTTVRVRTIDGPQPAETGAFDAMAYVDLWNGDPSLPRYDMERVSRDRWQSVVRTAQAEGIDALSDDDRKLLLQGSMKAYLLSVHGTRREILSSVGRSVVREDYQRSDGLYVALVRRASTGAESEWPDVVFADGDANVETRAFLGSTGDDTIIAEHWARDASDRWTCEASSTDTTTFSFPVFEYFTHHAEIVLAGEFVGEASLADRSAYQFAWEWPDGSIRRAWIDRETFIPLRLHLPEEPRGVASRTITITELNPTDPIEPPAETCPSS